jgi:cyclophilin family peptidyl-prolyl cis-trans isomerase
MDAIASHAELFVTGGADGKPGVALDGVMGAISQAVNRFLPEGHAYSPLVSAAAAVAALGDPAGTEILAKLAADPRPELRWAALEAYAKMAGAEPPLSLPTTAPARPVPAGEKAAWRTRKATADIQTTRGAIVVRLRPDIAPSTVASFVALAKDGYYDETEIHRVVPNFVVQAGDPTGTGLGDPGYSLRCEVSPLPFERGAVGMALSGKDTGGSQFFVTISFQPHLDGNYTLFGEVVEGMDVVDLIEEGDAILSVLIDADDPD